MYSKLNTKIITQQVHKQAQKHDTICLMEVLIKNLQKILIHIIAFYKNDTCMFGFVWVWYPMGREGVIIDWCGLIMKSSRKQVNKNSREQTQSTSTVNPATTEEHLRFKPYQLCIEVRDNFFFQFNLFPVHHFI